jgi:hypothetical protein
MWYFIVAVIAYFCFVSFVQYAYYAELRGFFKTSSDDRLFLFYIGLVGSILWIVAIPLILIWTGSWYVGKKLADIKLKKSGVKRGR